MGRRRLFLALLTWVTYSPSSGEERNLPPVFAQDMNNLALSESTPVGHVVYTLKGEDPEGLPIRYGLVGTDRFQVDPDTGDVTLVQPLDREVNDTLKFLVSIEERADGSLNSNKVQLPVSVIILDENDNAPIFKNSPYEADVAENEEIGKTILKNIVVEDLDTVGDNLEVGCVPNPQWADACDVFRVVALQSSQNEYTGALVLNAPLDYNQRQFYQLSLVASDGILNSTTSVEVRVVDIQNLPPVFTGSLTAALSEDAPIGTLALTLQARDGDRANPRQINYDLLTNPLDFFLLDSTTGDLRTAKPLDREALNDPSSPLNITVRAREVVNGQPLTSNLTSTLATVTVTIRDVNDEPPRFNRAEYSVEIPENFPLGSPLPNLDMVVTDTDVGLNSAFSLRLSDVSGAFTVEPETATGSTQVSIRLNNTQLDFEQPDQRKFIIVVIAEELHTNPRLSSKATVVVSVTDVNDNAPQFPEEAYWAYVSEAAPAGAHVVTITATDRDKDRFGSDGIVYQLFGSGAELFSVDNRTGVISVASCATPGHAPCLDVETRKDYFLSYKATDDDGSGQNSVVSLKISLSDANDNPPIFNSQHYKASIDEDATKFEPELQVQARDADETSEVRYSIVNNTSQFWIDGVTGKLGVRGQLSSGQDKPVFLTILATDGVHNATCEVEIAIRDVNNHSPMFDTQHYNASISEDVPLGTEITTVKASDKDSGTNAELKYSIQKGSFDAFTVNNVSGVVSVSSKLDYDKRNTYRIQIVATDLGIPSLTGTTELVVTIINANDKKPYFTPQIQRAEVSADAEIGTVIHNLIAMDPDIVNIEDLKFELSEERPIKVVDSNGKEVWETPEFRSWFAVTPSGAVRVTQPLQRSRAAVIALPVTVADTTAPELQRADGELVITIVDVNRHAPVFPQSHYSERLLEEQAPNTVLNTYTATDRDSTISHYAIEPPNPYFQINNLTGVVRSTQRIDYERIRRIDFTVVAYDTGAPQLSSNATVTVDVENVNDEEPRFDNEQGYEATVLENAKEGTPVLTVHATDADEGQFGEIRYELSGEHASKFTMDPVRGELTVARGADIDREIAQEFWVQAVAVDNAPVASRHTASVPVHIKVIDANDNPPVFSQKVYKGTVAENLPLNPPAPILQVRADDKDTGINSQVLYQITEQSVPGTFQVDPANGIIYPALPVKGNTTYHVTVTATDQNGQGLHTDTARVDINVTSVNQHSPKFINPPEGQNTIEIPENAAQSDLLVMTVRAEDSDAGENGRVSYFLRVGNNNTRETQEFRIDENSGELRSKTFLDRETSPNYPLVLVARDNGSPPIEVLHFLTVMLEDSNDNVPQFPKHLYEFTVSENQPVGIIIGTVKAVDKDSGEHGKVYYHVVDGNQEGAFTLDRTQGFLRANVSFDREKQSDYTLTVYASNNPILEQAANALNSIESADTGNTTEYGSGERSVATVHVRVLDENDNEPSFERNTYYAGVKYTAIAGETVASVEARDADAGGNGTLAYLIAASNLYRVGERTSSGSVVPSPFNITQDGTLLTAGFMAEYNQERFVLDIIAQEIEPPHRQAKTQVYVWIVSEMQTARVVVSRPCAEAAHERPRLERRLSDATGELVVAGTVKHYVHSDRLYEDWCELHLMAVNKQSYEVIPVAKLLLSVDSQYDQLRELYQSAGIETLTPSTGNKVEEKFDPALAALIALLIVLFTGLVTFVVVCACLRHWVISPPSMESSKGDSLARRRILDELSTTENPLWLENKLRPYEEQELTMNVFGEQEAAAANALPPPTDNMYATIQGGTCASGTERDYATLGGGSSPTPLEAMLGFQGSTFQPPAPDTPEPPPRPSVGLPAV